MDLHGFRPFSTTFVVYRGGDGLGFLLAGASLAPIFAVVALVTLIVSRRDLATIAACTGQLANEVLNAALKWAIRAERPAHALHAFSPKYGMPSNHAQFMGFFAVYFSVWALTRWRVGRVWRSATAVAFHAAAVVVMWSRVYLHYHTTAQVAVGYAVGAAAAAAWWTVVERYARPHFARIAAWPVCRWALVRDTTGCDNVLAAEYAAVANGTAAAEASDTVDDPRAVQSPPGSKPSGRVGAGPATPSTRHRRPGKPAAMD